MSFAIREEGLVADVIARIEAADNHGDLTQFEAVRALVLGELQAWPTGPGAPNGALVEVAGHFDDTSRNVTIVVRPVRIGTPED